MKKALLLLPLFACQLPLASNQQKENTKALEAENRSLKQELEALRKELASLRAPSPNPPNAVAPLLVTLPGPGSYPSSGPTSNPGELESRVLLGRAEQDQLAKQYGEGYVADRYRQALINTPDDPAALYLAARFSPDADDQMAYCLKAVSLAPSFGFGHHCLSVAHQKKGDGVAALAAAQEALKYSAAVEISANSKALSQREMKWYTPSLSWLGGEAKVIREFSLGPARTSVSLHNVKRGLSCAASLREEEAWKGCAGVVCGDASFSYYFDGPEDPYYDHTEACGEALVFTDQGGKTLLSETALPCSRLNTGKTVSAPVSICLPSTDAQIGEMRLNLPGNNEPLSSTTNNAQ